MENNSLQHHGILGQKWGVRRFQNEDGTRTAAGKRRAGIVSTQKSRIPLPAMKDGYEKPPKWVYDHAKVDGPTIYDKKEKPDVSPLNGKVMKHLTKTIDKIRSKKDGQLDEVKDDRKTASKNRRTLSDSELKKRIERLQTEKRLKELTEDDLSPGKAAVKQILSSSGKKVASAVVTGATLYAIKAVMTKQFNIKELAAYMTPKPKNK